MLRLTLDNVSKTRFGRRLLDGVSLHLHDGERMAITGENGSGKTTLLDCLAGVLPLEPNEGTITRASGSRITYVRQRHDTTCDTTFVDTTLLRLESRLRTIEQRMAAGAHDPATLNDYANAIAAFEAEDGHNRRHLVKKMLADFGLSSDVYERPLNTLSGGERMRLELALALVTPPDILLLDEPTNHLDLRGIQSLETWLTSYNGLCVFVSHDRHFMNAVATTVGRLSGAHLDTIDGTYDHFADVMLAREHDLTTHIKAETRALARERAVAQTMLQHRNMAQYHNRTQRADKINAHLNALKARAKRHDKTLHLSLANVHDDGDPARIVMRVTGLTDGYSEMLFRDVSFDLKARERVAILGLNGCGKSTLLLSLSQTRTPKAGSIVFAPGVRMTMLDQHVTFDEPECTVLEHITAVAGAVDPTQIRTRLAQFGFAGVDLEKTLGVLSGGEAARIKLLELTFVQPILLGLDEPTNHLDLHTRACLETMLATYPGALLFISHDRTFLERVATRCLGFVDGALLPFASVDEWLSAIAHADAQRTCENAPTHTNKSTSSVTPETATTETCAQGSPDRAARRREGARLRTTIASLEQTLKAIEEDIKGLERSFDAATPPDVYTRYAALKQEQNETSEELLQAWEALERFDRDERGA